MRVVAQHHRVRLRAMDKPQRDARISRMEQRTLALDDIPMIGGGIRRQAFSGASREIRSEEHTSELQSLMRISYAVFCLKKKNSNTSTNAQEQKHKRCKHKLTTQP